MQPNERTGNDTSHITDVKLQVKDLAAIAEVGDALGFEFLEGKKNYNWYQRFMNDSEEGRRVVAERGVDSLGKCDHVLRPKNASAGDYEIGLVAEKDGSYSLLYDTFGSGQKLERLAGPGLVKLRREYAAAVAAKRAKATLARRGFTQQREDLPNGAIRLRLRRR